VLFDDKVGAAPNARLIASGTKLLRDW